MSEELGAGQLSDEQRKKIEESVDVASFDLGAFLDDKWEWPSFHATVHLDGASAARIAEIKQEIDNLAKKAAKSQEDSGGLGSLGSSNGKIQAQIEKLNAEGAELQRKLKGSALKLTFRLSEPGGTIHKKIDEEVKNRFPELTKDERESSEEATLLRAILMVKHSLYQVHNGAGALYKGVVDENMVRSLYSKLIPSEWVKVQNNMMLAFTGGNVMQQAVDAGFPG